MKRLLMVDSHTLFCEGMEVLLAPQGFSVSCAATEQEALIQVRQQRPHLILFDPFTTQQQQKKPVRPQARSQENFKTLEQFCKKTQEIPLIVLTGSQQEQDLMLALKSGAQGYLLKGMTIAEIIPLLEQALQGETVVAPEMHGLLARIAQGEVIEKYQQADLKNLLTRREYQILSHIAEGQTNKMIGKELGISDGTVKLHVNAILKKLDVHSRVEAAVIAIERGISKKIPQR